MSAIGQYFLYLFNMLNAIFLNILCKIITCMQFSTSIEQFQAKQNEGHHEA